MATITLDHLELADVCQIISREKFKELFGDAVMITAENIVKVIDSGIIGIPSLISFAQGLLKEASPGVAEAFLEKVHKARNELEREEQAAYNWFFLRIGELIWLTNDAEFGIWARQAWQQARDRKEAVHRQYLWNIAYLIADYLRDNWPDIARALKSREETVR
jgi:hypothetical protein